MAAEPGQASGVPAPPEEKSQDQGSKTGSAKRPEQTARVLADEDVMTVADVANPDAVGEFTNELSDLTDDENPDGIKPSHGRTWYNRIQPLLNNKRIRHFVITNITLTIVNTFLFFMFVCGIVYAVMLHEEVSHRSVLNKPCIFEWAEWGECSATCRSENGDVPIKSRKVNPNKIVRARGRFADLSPCPMNLENKVDFAPCNTHYCPKKLSSFDFTKRCFKVYVDDEKKGCYHIRNVSLKDQLIEIDVTDLTKPVNCSTCLGSARPVD
ncbi:unnamed protein product [Bursaphelenchus xylophilus]|uniref:(pine wood nematode) hypothetical protein n=1 Tax=Bursaphelenchus xylophilus TaxID=6326 RepID=A0A7I8XQP5_BURXY|nr:unnamed protein product [Bursaphelenchus xylophilus]CAG9088625.1 unnamed protein product [Bursaphelenchus xylophilus]